MTDFLAKNITTGQVTYLDVLNDDYVALTDDEISAYNAQQAKTLQKADLQAQINELEVKAQRSLIAKTAGIATDEDNTYFSNYVQQITELRIQINNLK